jgi:hypothetical protein
MLCVSVSVCLSACLCLCVRERAIERERQRGREGGRGGEREQDRARERESARALMCLNQDTDLNTDLLHANRSGRQIRYTQHVCLKQPNMF